MGWMILAQCAVLAAIGSGFLTNWPWHWRDKRKLIKYLSEVDCRLIQLRSGFWSKWQRVGILAWITYRARDVIYVDSHGQHHRATATFYFPWWLNKAFYDSGLIDNWDLVEIAERDHADTDSR